MFDAYKISLEFFNKGFINYFKDNSRFNDILNYSIAEGKRIRPIILIETYKMLNSGVVDNHVINFAHALELIHNYSLVHDDLPAMDNDDYRRGRLTVHKKYGEDMAILVGDSLLNQAYEILFQEISSARDLIDMTFRANAAKTIAEYSGLNGMIKGQVIDVLEVSNSKEAILEMYECKTSGLIMAATCSASYLAHGDEKTIDDMRELGSLIGLGFQLQDDLLDIEADMKIGKKTYITYSSESETKELIDSLTNKAINLLDNYSDSDFLKELVRRLVKREY